MQIYLSHGLPDVEISDTLSVVSLAEFADSPMLVKLTRERRRLWEAQLRDLIVQLRMLSLSETKVGDE